MAQVSLKSYENEIRSLIENGKFDEAMSVGQHVLQHYPKHLNTYSLLAEACFGLGRYEEGADLLLRVLSVDPENVSARVGLSKAHEANGDIDGALGQMRIAFDLAPSLREIHNEMHRLLNLKMGERAPKLKLTRQGLGRIYVRGELYTQAADEFETLLRENPDQIDVEVSLAEALWRDAQRIRSIEVCQSVLNKLPYCAKAHLILADTWLRSDREDEAAAHLKIVRELDPEGGIAYRLLGDASPLPRTEVSLPGPGEAPEFGHEETIAAQGIPAGAEVGREGQAASDADTIVSRTAVGEADVAEIPAWLQEAKPEGIEDELLEEAEIPAWLAAGAAGVVAAEALQDSPEAAPAVDEDIETIDEEGIPDWLLAAAPAAIETGAPAEESADDVQVPAVAEEVVTAGAEMVEEEIESADESELPPWLLETYEQSSVTAETAVPSAETAEPVDVQEEELPSWLREVEEPEPRTRDEIESARAEMPEEAVAPTDADEAGLAAMGIAAATALTEEEEEALVAAAVQREELSAEEGEVPDWLRELQAEETPPAALEPIAEQVVETEEPEAAEEETVITEEMLLEQEKQEPTWLRILREEGLEDELASEEELSLAAMGAAAATTLTEEVEEEETLVAEAVEPEQLPAEEEPVITEEMLLEQEKQEPTWLRILREEGLEDELVSEEELSLAAMGAAAATTLTEEVEEVEEEEETLVAEAMEPEEPPAEDMEFPAWLHTLQVEEGLAATVAPEDEAVSAESETSETEPEWLRQLKEEQWPDETELPSEASLLEVGLIDAELAEEQISGEIDGMPSDSSQLELDFEEPVPPAEERPVDLPTEEQLEEAGLIEEAEAAEEVAGAEEDELPEWLRKAALAEGLLDEPSEDEGIIEEGQEEGEDLEAVEAVEVVDAVESVEDEPGEAEEQPDWLQLLQGKETSQYVMPETEEDESTVLEAEQPMDAAGEELGIPDWLQILRQGTQEQAEASSEPEPADQAVPSAGARPAIGEPEERRPEAGGDFFPDKALDMSAILNFENTLKDNPKDHAVRWELIQAYAHAGNHASAIMHSAQLVETGELLPEIVEYLEQVTQSSWQTREAFQILGEAYFKQDRLQEASDAYRKALAMLG